MHISTPGEYKSPAMEWSKVAIKNALVIGPSETIHGESFVDGSQRGQAGKEDPEDDKGPKGRTASVKNRGGLTLTRDC